YLDRDLDGYGTGAALNRCANPGDGYSTNDDDCQDGDRYINPAATEVCDNIDNDCVGGIDNGLTFIDYYLDSDRDGYGTGAALNRCANPGDGYSTNDDDCQDGDRYINPGATEVCDGIDNDCYGGADNALTFLDYYADTDSDGYGNQNDTATRSCSPIAGEATNALDCNDTNGAIKPGATELCDNIDNNCDQYIDEGYSVDDYYVDADRDGYGAGDATRFCSDPGDGYSTLNTDCQDGDIYIFPGAPELCSNIGVDNNCSQGGTGVDKTATDTIRYYLDSDGDNYGTGSGLLACSKPFGYGEFPGDCAPSDSAINPGAAEICDGKDNNCSGGIDEGVTTTFYDDDDGDGYGDSTDTYAACSAPSGYVSISGDCDDRPVIGFPINPAGTETCDGLNADEDCDGYADDADPQGNATGKTPLYKDVDTDTFGDAYASVSRCDAGDGYVVSNGSDCNDNNIAVNPNATETCNSIDDDCDGSIDDGLPFLDYYVDGDGDGYGALSDTIPTSSCSAVTGEVANNLDCWDSDSYINPAATEICDTRDNDCDGYIDEYVQDTYYDDEDGDTYGDPAWSYTGCSMPPGYVTNSNDCDGTDANKWTSSSGETCDGYDNDCNGTVDDGVTDRYYEDADGDGFTGDTYQDACSAPSHTAPAGPWKLTNDGDCGDSYPDVYPGATETCTNIAVDNDCDGIMTEAEASDAVDYYSDVDGDTYGGGTPQRLCSNPGALVTNGTDCDDTDRYSYSTSTAEICDGYDNDCDDTADENLTFTTYYPDVDGDGYGDKDSSGTSSCSPIAGVTNNDDCDDGAAAIKPGAAELCNDLYTDNDCDGSTLDVDANASDKVDFYADADLDGYSVNTPARFCPGTTNAGYIASLSSPVDCYDNNIDAYPGAPETCSDIGTDNDCDGDSAEHVLTHLYRDVDGDGYGAGAIFPACPPVTGYVTNSSDCDDSSNIKFPGNPEVCDGVDNDCYGGVDDGFTNTDLDSYADCVDTDDDNDTVLDVSDNCPLVGNLDQANTDNTADGGDACDTDDDNDTFLDVYDNCPLISNVGQANFDGDAYGDDCDSDDDNDNDPDVTDCADNDAYIFNGATEVCDGINQDCDAYTDEGYTNTDGDSYADCVDTDDDNDSYLDGSDNCPLVSNSDQLNTDSPADGYGDACDSDDDNDSYLDGSDNCPLVSNADQANFDGDAYGDVCDSDDDNDNDPDVTDCADNDAYIFNGATELCDGINQDCDAYTDEGYTNTDGDSYADCVDTDDDNDLDPDTSDCAPLNSAVHAGATEVVGDGIDNNCDTYELCYLDRDDDGFLDGYGTTVQSDDDQCDDAYESAANAPTGDCNDTNSAIYPNAPELCATNTVDNDCDTYVDDVDAKASDRVLYYTDSDNDTFTTSVTARLCPGANPGYRLTQSAEPDCGDSYADVYPGAAENCGNIAVDNDCDGVTSADEASDSTDFYTDSDGDGFGTGNSFKACGDTPTTSAVAGDCGDAYADVYPGAAELCSTTSVNNNCDNVTDDVDANAADKVDFYADADGDGFTTAATSRFCTGTSNTGWRETPSASVDCGDAYADVYPGAAELCSTTSVDNNCDNVTDDVDTNAADKVDFYADADGDTWTTAVTSKFCSGTTNAGWRATLSSPVDCDDAYGSGAAIYPGAPETCANLGTNNDCDGYNDAAEASDSTDFFTDADGDGFGTGTAFKACGDTATTSAVAGDCNDTYGVGAAINPAATEVCDGVDNNCAGGTDEGFPTSVYYLDSDNDEYGAIPSVGSFCSEAAARVQLSNPTGHYSTVAGDCQNGDAAIYPGAAETCANVGTDNDCSQGGTGVDKSASDMQRFFADVDGDQYGAGSGVRACSAPQGYVLASGDCNDNNAAIRPGATEIAGDGVDQNCDTDELCFRDLDNDGYLDGYGLTAVSDDLDCDDAYENPANSPTGDCNDSAADVRPGAAETCANIAVDNDCDSDTSFNEASDSVNYYADSDNDNYGAGAAFKQCTDDTTRALVDGDCAPTNPAINPGATEVCDGYDNNCAGGTDEGFANYDLDSYADCVDTDDDNDNEADATDCNDNAADVYTNAPEVCANYGVDNDCDGDVYEAKTLNFYRDADGDGYGVEAQHIMGCDQPKGYVLDVYGDCNDASAAIKPGATEIAGDGVDQNCDTDELCYVDGDDDGYLAGTGATAVSDDLDCDDAYESATNSPTGDCNDAASAIRPGATEIAGDGVDQNCDTDELCYVDGDDDGFLDGYGVTAASDDLDCLDAYESATNSPTGDCNDAASAINPAAAELPGDGVDQNCDTDELCFRDLDDDGYLDGYGATAVSDDLDCDDTYESATNSPTGDCNDAAAAINPGAAELPGDGVDQNCDSDELCYVDGDNDGYLDGYGVTAVSDDLDCDDANESATNSPTGDCNDAAAAINPGATEIAGDGVDQNCDTDELCYVDGDDDGFLAGTGATAVSDDLDCDDTYESATNSPTGDCNDAAAAINPAAAEVCDSYVDNDCDGYSDDADPSVSGRPTWYEDGDIDGQGDQYVSLERCVQPTGYVSNSTDLCPNDQNVFAPSLWYADADVGGGDGYGDPAVSVSSCPTGLPPGYVANSGDGCPTVKALQAPVTWYSDLGDGDGFGDPAVSESECVASPGYVGNNGDGCPTQILLQAPVSYFVDADLDRYGDSNVAQVSLCATPAPDGYSSVGGDCNDSVNGLVSPIRYYRDSDSDQYGDPSDTYDVCSLTPPVGYVAVAGDTCPNDIAKLAPGDCGCGTPDVDDDRDGISDCIDPTPALRLIPRNSGLFDSGDGYVVVDVELGARLSTQPTVGAQLALVYDKVNLTFVSAAPGSSTAGNGLFSQPVFLNHTASAGTILYSVGVADGFAGGTSPTRVATLTFRVADGVTAICGASGMVEFATVSSAETKLSASGGVEVLPTKFDLGPVTAYSAGTGLIGMPSNSSRPADAGLAGAVIAAPSVTFVPACGASAATPAVAWYYADDFCGGATDDFGTGWPTLFRVGHTMVTWTAGGLTGSSCYTVENHQVMDLSVALGGVSVAANSRTLNIATGAFTGTATASLGSTASTVSVQVPVTAGYDCVSVKDTTHTLRHTAAVSVSGTKYVASFTGTNALQQGNSNGDRTVDILDFGMYASDFGAGKAANARSNFDGDSFVDSLDFAVISVNFFKIEAAACPGSSLDGGVASDDGPMDRVSVRELRRMGQGELAIADLNGDGWLDTEDMSLWMQGHRPRGHGD
ncbi:MAG: hypothetical protein FGM37_00400, partial [Phycisphaerales bacterium]|nr:hypothetical protein [Phycisphaerales bacterium]